MRAVLDDTTVEFIVMWALLALEEQERIRKVERRKREKEAARKKQNMEDGVPCRSS